MNTEFITGLAQQENSPARRQLQEVNRLKNRGDAMLLFHGHHPGSVFTSQVYAQEGLPFALFQVLFVSALLLCLIDPGVLVLLSLKTATQAGSRFSSMPSLARSLIFIASWTISM